jgi:hypothetical protein
MPIFSAKPNQRIPSLPDCSSASERAYLLRLQPSRWLFGWWILLHLLLAFTALMANLTVAVSGMAFVALIVHFRLRYPVNGTLLIVSAGACFALPLEGRFNLTLSGTTRIGRFWIELVFSDCPKSRFLVLKDQIQEPEWRRLCLILREGV